MKFFYPVFYWGTGEYDCKGRFQLFYAFGCAGIPVFYPLGLIKYDEVGGPFPYHAHIPEYEFVIDELIERLFTVLELSLIIEALHHYSMPFAEFLYFRLPLIFQ